MKAIVISQEEFDLAFKQLETSLDLAALQSKKPSYGAAERDAVEQTHRTFVYHLHQFKSRLEKGVVR